MAQICHQIKVGQKGIASSNPKERRQIWQKKEEKKKKKKLSGNKTSVSETKLTDSSDI